MSSSPPVASSLTGLNLSCQLPIGDAHPPIKCLAETTSMAPLVGIHHSRQFPAEVQAVADMPHSSGQLSNPAQMSSFVADAGGYSCAIGTTDHTSCVPKLAQHPGGTTGQYQYLPAVYAAQLHACSSLSAGISPQSDAPHTRPFIEGSVLEACVAHNRQIPARDSLGPDNAAGRSIMALKGVGTHQQIGTIDASGIHKDVRAGSSPPKQASVRSEAVVIAGESAVQRVCAVAEQQRVANDAQHLPVLTHVQPHIDTLGGALHKGQELDMFGRIKLRQHAGAMLDHAPVATESAILSGSPEALYPPFKASQCHLIPKTDGAPLQGMHAPTSSAMANDRQQNGGRTSQMAMPSSLAHAPTHHKLHWQKLGAVQSQASAQGAPPQPAPPASARAHTPPMVPRPLDELTLQAMCHVLGMDTKLCRQVLEDNMALLGQPEVVLPNKDVSTAALQAVTNGLKGQPNLGEPDAQNAVEAGGHVSASPGAHAQGVATKADDMRCQKASEHALAPAFADGGPASELKQWLQVARNYSAGRLEPIPQPYSSAAKLVTVAQPTGVPCVTSCSTQLVHKRVQECVQVDSNMCTILTGVPKLPVPSASFQTSPNLPSSPDHSPPRAVAETHLTPPFHRRDSTHSEEVLEQRTQHGKQGCSPGAAERQVHRQAQAQAGAHTTILKGYKATLGEPPAQVLKQQEIFTLAGSKAPECGTGGSSPRSSVQHLAPLGTPTIEDQQQQWLQEVSQLVDTFSKWETPELVGGLAWKQRMLRERYLHRGGKHDTQRDLPEVLGCLTDAPLSGSEAGDLPALSQYHQSMLCRGPTLEPSDLKQQAQEPKAQVMPQQAAPRSVPLARESRPSFDGSYGFDVAHEAHQAPAAYDMDIGPDLDIQWQAKKDDVVEVRLSLGHGWLATDRVPPEPSTYSDNLQRPEGAFVTGQKPLAEPQRGTKRALVQLQAAPVQESTTTLRLADLGAQMQLEPQQASSAGKQGDASERGLLPRFASVPTKSQRMPLDERPIFMPRKTHAPQRAPAPRYSAALAVGPPQSQPFAKQVASMPQAGSPTQGVTNVGAPWLSSVPAQKVGAGNAALDQASQRTSTEAITLKYQLVPCTLPQPAYKPNGDARAAGVLGQVAAHAGQPVWPSLTCGLQASALEEHQLQSPKRVRVSASQAGRFACMTTDGLLIGVLDDLPAGYALLVPGQQLYNK